MRLISVPVALVIVGALVIRTSSGSPQAKANFEVASVKPSAEFRPDDHGRYAGPSLGGLLNVSNASLQSMIIFAFDIRESQISGGPSWIRADQFNVSAKMGGPAIADPSARRIRAKEMFRTLLEQQFGLRFHRSEIQTKGYELAVAKLESKLKPTTSVDASDSGSRLTLVGLVCNGTVSDPDRKPMSVIEGKGQPISQLASCLSETLQTSVIDTTGLTGAYDFRITGFDRPGAIGLSSQAPAVPSIFDVLQEELGLRLISRQVPVELFVIESVEKPLPDQR